MSYQVLARKWRPRDFSELVGQQQTSQALINALTTQRLHHAYLFTGTRGVGKTTIARILSKSLNCEQGVTPNPCGECSSCIEIAQGNFVDLLEIDAASKTKVEDTRELLDNVQYRPTRGRYKVYLIDEVHMLSGHSFNALLKTLEEPPPHVIFLLATTDPQKLPVTVLSRCLQFHLRRMELSEITMQLTKILTAENIQFQPAALDAIAKGADGSMRDALSLLDQAIAFCGDDLQTQAVLDMLGSIDKEYSFQLLDAMCAGDATVLLSVIENINQFSPDYDELLGDWLSLLHEIAVAQAVDGGSEARIVELSKQINRADIQLFYQLTLQARKDLAYAPSPRQGFEMAMLRVLSFKPQPMQPNKISPQATATSEPKTNYANPKSIVNNTSPKASAVTPQSLQSTAEKKTLNSDALATAKVESQNTVSALTPPKISRVVNGDPEKAPSAATILPFVNEKNSDREAVKANENVEQQSAVHSEASKPQEKPIVRLALDDITSNNWHQVVEQMTLEGQGLQILLNSIAVHESGLLQINYHEKVEPLLTTNTSQNVIEGLQNYFQSTELKIAFNAVEATSETPKERQQRLYQIAVDDAYKKIMADPQINYLLTELNATLSKDSIQFVDTQKVVNSNNN